MGHNYGSHVPRTCVWRAWCHRCVRHLAYLGRHSEWPDEIMCPRCGGWRKVLARGKGHLAGDIVCPHGSGRNRVEDR